MISRTLYKTRADGVSIYRTCSVQSNCTCRVQCDQTGQIYWDAFDVEDSTATYTEVLPTPTSIPYWRLPENAENGYSEGDRVVFKNKIWESVLNNNACVPGDFGWDEIYPFPSFDNEGGAE